MNGKHYFHRRMSQFVFTSLFLIAPLLLLGLSPLHMPTPPNGSISGTAIYYGNLTGGQIGLGAHLDKGNLPVNGVFIPHPGGTYTIPGLPDDPYYVSAYYDKNNSGGPPDPDEPVYWYDSDGDGDADQVTVSGGNVPNINIALGDIIYVKWNASGSNNGTSWVNAYTSLQSALSDPKTANAGAEIWVAAGTYKPGSARANTFQLKKGVAIYGGFAGSEMLRSHRDLKANVTILSGEIGNAGDKTDNIYHVVTGSGTDNTAILSDVTIMRGYANDEGAGYSGFGGGMKNYNGSPTVVNVRFLDNTAISGGGGMVNAQNPYPYTLVINCTFSGNAITTGLGAGMLNWTRSGQGGHAWVINSSFAGNSAEAVFVNGADSDVVLENVIVSGSLSVISGDMWILYSSLTGSCPASASCDANTKLSTNPLFVDANGADDVYGTLDDNLRLQINSPAIDAGDNSDVPADTADIDGDGNTTEIIPIDLDGTPRFIDTSVTDTGSGTPPIVDMGAFEAFNYVFLPIVMR